MADLSNLSPAEYEKISTVLKRDRELRLMEEARIKQLKQELICLRKRAAIKPGLDPLRNCARCLTELGRILNRGALCPLCHKKVCKDCRHYGVQNHEWLCIYCFKQMQLKAASGEWMLEYSCLPSQNRAKDSAGDQLRKALHDTQRREMLSNTIAKPTFSPLPVDPPPEKPPRIFACESSPPTLPSEAQIKNIDKCQNGGYTVSSNEKISPEQPRSPRQPSPKVLPRISPWNDIDPEPALPVRIDKSRPIGLQQYEPLSFKERQSSDEGHSAGYRSRSMSSDVMDDSESHVPVPLPRKRINPLKKQQALPDQNPVDNQQSSVDTTDSGVYSPLKTDLSLDTNPPASPLMVSRLSSNEQEYLDSPSFAPCLASESSLSETDEDHRHFFRKRKTVHSRSSEDKCSATSAGPQSLIPPSGLNQSVPYYNIYSNSFFNTNFKAKLIGSCFDFSNNFRSNSRADACRKNVTYNRVLAGSNFQMSSKACALHNNSKAPDVGGKGSGSKERKHPQTCDSRMKTQSMEQDGIKTKRKDRKKNFLQFPHLRKKRGKKKEYIMRCSQHQTTEDTSNDNSLCNLCPGTHNQSEKLLHLNTLHELQHISVGKPLDNRTEGSRKMMVRSASLPSHKTFSEDWLKPWLWKCHSLEDWLWCLEEQPCQSRNFKEIANMLPDDYKLVYVSSSSSEFECDSDCLMTGYHRYQSRKKSKKHLKVNSHIKINYGTSYVEDSDWEFESENGEEPQSFTYGKSNNESKINEANNFLINFVSRESDNYVVEGCFSPVRDKLGFGKNSMEKNSCLSNISAIHFWKSPLTDFHFLSQNSYFYSYNSVHNGKSPCFEIENCLTFPDCQDMKIDKSLEKLNIPVFTENISNWPNFASGRPISHAFSLLSPFTTIDGQKPDFFITHPLHFRTNSQLQLISNHDSFNSSHLSNDIFFRPCDLDSYFNKCFRKDTLQNASFHNATHILECVSKKLCSFSDDVNCVPQFFVNQEIPLFSQLLNQLYCKREKSSKLIKPHSDALHPLCRTLYSLLYYVKLFFEANNLTIIFEEQENKLGLVKLISKSNYPHISHCLANTNFISNVLADFFELYKTCLRNKTPNDLFDSVSWRRDCCERKVGNWLQLDDANAFHYTSFPLFFHATNRGNDNSATGWGKLRCSIAVATERVIDLNPKALVCGREALESADLTPYLGWEAGTKDKLSEILVNAFLYRNPPVFKKPEVDYLLCLTRSEPSVLLQRFLHAKAETRMIAAKFEVTGVSPFDKTDHDNTISPNEREQNCGGMQSKNIRIFAQNEAFEIVHFATNSARINGGDANETQSESRTSDSGCFKNVNKQQASFLRWNAPENVERSDKYSFKKVAAAELKRICRTSSEKYDLNSYENPDACDKDDSCEFLDEEILPCIKNIFNIQLESAYSNCDHETVVSGPSVLFDNSDFNERVDCQCNKPCEVPSSPSVVDATVERSVADDGEIFSSGDELDKFESDTDSQDTVIEGEAYKRIRSVAIKEKILHANEELFGSNNKETFFKPHTSSAFTSCEISERNDKSNQKVKMSSLEEIKSKISTQSFLQTQYQGDAPELPIFSDSEESDSLSIFSSLEKHFQSFKNQNLSYLPISTSFGNEKSDDSGEIHSLSSYCSSLNEPVGSSESSDNGSDGEEVILSDTSTSSDEATYIAPTSGFQYYSHPMSYKLHTIAEESCEESERSSRNSIPLSTSCSDFEYFDKGRLPVVKNTKKIHRKSQSDNSASSSSSELKNAKSSAAYAVLATSRLEKYFKCSLQGGDKVSYPDEDMTDESGEVSSDDDMVSGRSVNQATNGKKCDSFYKSPKVPLSSSDRCFATVKCHRIGSPSYKNLNQNLKVTQQTESNKESNLTKFNLAPNSESNFLESKQNKANEQVSDDEAKYIMNHLMLHITNNSEVNSEPSTELKDMTPMIKILESEIARLMLTVSPASLSAGEPSSSCSSTIGSNNSDYGSDTLESAEESTSEEEINANISAENRPVVEVSAPVDPVPSQNEQASSSNSQSTDFVSPSDPVVSEETLYICKQLMASLKKIADSTEGACASSDVCIVTEDHCAKQYITDQIVSLMQTVNASQNSSPFLQRLTSNSSAIQIDSDVSQDRSDSDSPPPNDEKREHSKSKTPSESGSETTISASISIPSYDDSDRTPTESEISHEMDELYALLESGSTSHDVINSAKFSYDLDNNPNSDKCVLSRNADSPLSDADVNFGFSESCDINPNSSESECSLLYGSSKLESLLPISVEERIARYKDAFLNRALDSKEQESRATENRINVILPQPSVSETVCYDIPLSLSFESVLNSKSAEKLPAVKSCDNILSSCSVHKVKGEENNYNITSVKIISHNTYPPSSAIHKILSNNIDSTYMDPKCDCNVSDSSFNKSSTSDGLLQDSHNTDDTDVHQCTDESESSILSPLPKVINPKEKASSENDLLVANYRTKSKSSKVFGTKSVGNICELENISNKNTFRDTGYYSFKSSEESFLSLDDSTASQTSTASLTQYRSLTSTETIPEEEESCAKGAASTKMSLSSSNIPDAVCDTSPSKSSTLPLSLRNKVSSTSNVNHRTRSSFFSTSGVLRKLTLLRDESGNSLRSSPHGRLRMRNRSLSGGSEDGRQRKTSVPHISVSECLENQSGRLSTASSEKDSSGMQDEDLDQHFTYPSRSQMSLSSFGGRSESVTSVYSAAGGGRYGTVIVTGDVLFGLSYNYKAGVLEINIKECRNLAAVDTKKNRSDPYVKVYLLPDRTKSGKRKTKVKKHTLNPVFDEVLKFKVTVSELEIRTLWLSVWHSERFGLNDFLGEVMLPLGNDTFECSGLKWHPLQERLETLDPPVSYKGDLILALKYIPADVAGQTFAKKPSNPAKGVLEVLVTEAKNLMATRSNGTSDPFCKSYLLPDKSKAGKQKTSVFKKSCNPKWNHTFVYGDVDDLRERCLELTIWDYDKITSNDFLGGVRLSLGTGKYQGKDVDWMDSFGEERSLWCAMLERPNTWVHGSLLLRSNMQSRRTV